MLFSKFYNYILNIGIKPDQSDITVRCLKIQNKLSFVSGVVLLVFPLIFIYLKLYEGLYFIAAGFAILTITLYSNHKGFFTFSKFFSIIASILMLISGLYLFGMNSGFEYPILAFIALPILYLRTNRERLSFYIIAIPVLIFSGLVLYYLGINRYESEELSVLRFLLFVATIILIVFYFMSSDGINKEYEKNNAMLVKSLTKKNKVLKQFSFSASHDLKEPLRTINSYTQLLKAELGDQFNESAKGYHNYITRGVRQMYTLLDDLLTYSNIDNEKISLELIDLNEVIEDVRYSMSATISKSQSKIVVESLPSIYGTHTLFTQLFQNLISNAIKFRKKDDKAIIVIDAETDGECCNIFVKDNGIGVSNEYSEKIFEIFQRLHPRYEYEGSGIGLATCKVIMEKLHGEISMVSTPNQGSTFKLSFPKSN